MTQAQQDRIENRKGGTSRFHPVPQHASKLQSTLWDLRCWATVCGIEDGVTVLTCSDPRHGIRGVLIARQMGEKAKYRCIQSR